MLQQQQQPLPDCINTNHHAMPKQQMSQQQQEFNNNKKCKIEKMIGMSTYFGGTTFPLFKFPVFSYRILLAVPE